VGDITTGAGLRLCGWLHWHNPFSPTCATFLAELCNPITRQAIEL